MSGALLGLLVGAGLLLLRASCTPRTARARTPGPLSRAVRHWHDHLAAAGLPDLSPAWLVAASGLGAVCVGVVTVVLPGPPSPLDLVLVAGAAAAPWAAVQARARRCREARREVWPQVVDDLAASVRAGMSLPDALAAVGETGPQELRGAFAAFARDYALDGRFAPGLDALKQRLADPVGDRLCEALRITREVGGSDLGLLLRTLSAFLRDDLRTRGELVARQSWTVSAARLAVAAPWLVVALLGTRGAAADAYLSPAGAVVLLCGAGVSAVAYRLMVRIARLPDDPRVLR